MICNNCGHYLPDEEKQCFHCGAVLDRRAKDRKPSHLSKRDKAPKGPSTQTLLVILAVVVVFALVIWGLVYFLNKPVDAVDNAPVSSQETPSVVSMQVSGEKIGQMEEWEILLVDQTQLYLCSLSTGEAQRICGMSEKGKSILSAAYCNDFIYFVEQSDSYNYLYRVAPSGESVAEKLRLNDEGAQMRTQIEQLMAVNGKLCGFARYPRVEGVREAYVELYQLNADGVYRASDTSTKILYTTQNSDEGKDNDPAQYTVEVYDTSITVKYNGETVADCQVG